MEFHDPLPLDPSRAAGHIPLSPGAFSNAWTRTPESRGTDPLGRRAKNLNRFPTTLPERGLIPEVRRRAVSRAVLVLLATLLLAQSLPRKRFFCPALLAGLHVKAMLLDLLDDVFLLHLTLESTQGILKRLILLNDHFGQRASPLFRFGLCACSAYCQPAALPLYALSQRLLASCSQFSLSKSSTLSPSSRSPFLLLSSEALFTLPPIAASSAVSFFLLAVPHN